MSVEKIRPTGFLVDKGRVENGRRQTVYLTPEQFVRSLNERYISAKSATRLPDVTLARVQPLYGIGILEK